MKHSNRAGGVLLQAIRELLTRYHRHNVGRDSAALTYYLLFAAFPLLVFVSALLGVLELDIESTMRALREFVPDEVAAVAEEYLRYVSAESSRQLLGVSLVFSVWLPVRAASSLIYSVRKAYDCGQPRSVWRSYLYNLLFTAWLMVTIGATLVLIMIGGNILRLMTERFAAAGGWVLLWSHLRFALIGAVMFLLLVPLYMLARGRRCPLREIVPGVLSSLLVWMALTLAFSYYVEHMARYTELYGSIAAIVVVLLWLYMSGTVLIMGAEFNAMLLTGRKRTRPRREKRGREETE